MTKLKNQQIKYLADIDEYLEKLEKRYKVVFEPKGVPLEPKADIKPREPQERDKSNSQGEPPATSVSEALGEPGMALRDGKATL